MNTITMFKYLGTAVAILSFLVGIFFYGKSSGYDEGYAIGYSEAKNIYEPKYNIAINKLNSYIQQSNDMQKELQVKAIEAVKEAQEWKEKYEQEFKIVLPEKEASQSAFTPSMVSAINSLL